jgi:hypothetical protein
MQMIEGYTGLQDLTDQAPPSALKTHPQENLSDKA